MRLRRNNVTAAPQTETAAFKKWFGKSKVVDAEGKPLVVYHGTPRGGFSVFKLVYNDRPGAVFFSNKRTVAGDYAGYGQKVDLPGPVPKSPPVFKSVTDLRRFVKSPENDFEGWKMHLLESEQVIEEDDSPSYTGMGARIVPRYVLWWEKGDRDVDIAEGYHLDVLLFEANAAVKRRLDIAGIYAVYLRMLKPMVVDGKGAPWMSVPYEGGYWKTDQLADIARSKGHDGLILRNIYDNPIQQIEISDVYVAFDPTQIKSATANVGTFDRKNADIRMNPDVPARVCLRGRGPSPKVEALVRDFTEASFPNPLGSAERNERVLKGIDALVRLEPDGRKVFVAEVRALRPRQGIGTRAMQFLTDLADKHGVQLALFPHPFGTAQMEVGALVNFYRRFGFQYADENGEAGDEMVRFPRESNPRRRVRRNPHPQTETPEFERWFGNSKMIDAEGKPQRLYHITAAEFTEFKPGGHDPRLSGRVIYLTPYPHDIPAGHNVSGTVSGERYRPGTNVMPVYASIQRPLYILDADDAQYAQQFRLDSFGFPKSVSDKSLAALKAAGYDGIVYGQYNEAAGFDIRTGRNVEIIAFEPTQVKSAIGNRGTFDPEDPNIMHNPRRRAAPRRALRFVRPPRRVVRRNGLHAPEEVHYPGVSAFVKEWHARDMDKVFAEMGVEVEVTVEGIDHVGIDSLDYIHLDSIEALRPGRGNGGRALRALLDLVDKHNLGITLIAMPFHRYDAEGNPLPGLDDLVRIYQRFGFRLLEDTEDEEETDEDEEPESYPMERPPRRNPARAQVVLEDVASDGPRAVVYSDGKEVGYAQLTRIQGLNDPDNPVWECEHEIRTLRQRVGPSTLWVMWRAYLDDEHQNKGYGVAMYEALLRGMHAQYNKPAIIFPEECVDGGRTSNAAMRVWASLSRRWESEGRAVASIPLTPNPRR